MHCILCSDGSRVNTGVLFSPKQDWVLNFLFPAIWPVKYLSTDCSLQKKHLCLLSGGTQVYEYKHDYLEESLTAWLLSKLTGVGFPSSIYNFPIQGILIRIIEAAMISKHHCVLRSLQEDTFLLMLLNHSSLFIISHGPIYVLYMCFMHILLVIIV